MGKEYFEWSDQIQLNVQGMDDEHKRLIQTMNHIYNLSSEKKPFVFIFEKIEELLKLTEIHFSNEEKYFSNLKYEKTEIHKQIHKDLIGKLKTHAQKIKTEQKVSEDFFAFLKMWLTAHIMGIDSGYAKVAV